MSNLNLLAQEKPIQPAADLGKARIGARLLFVFVAAWRRTDAKAADRSVMKVRPVAMCHYRKATGPVWCQAMDGVAFRTRDEATMNRIAYFIEMIAFSSRWLVAPFLLGLIFGLAVLLYKFVIKLVDFVGQVPGAETSDAIVGILNLVDLTLVANLIVIVICSSYENFVSPIDNSKHPTWPPGLVNIGFSGLKQKLLGSIVAIAAVNVLEWFTDIDRNSDSVKLAWVVGILLAFAVAMLVLAIADRVSGATEERP